MKIPAPHPALFVVLILLIFWIASARGVAIAIEGLGRP